MNSVTQITPLTDLPSGVEGLRAEAVEGGFRFMDKLVLEWRSGTNRFAQPGEVFLGVFHSDNLIAVGGLNHDPYADQDGIGRLRHLYVQKLARRNGVGRMLVRQLLGHADGVFQCVRLRTKTPEAAAFYVSLGFLSVQDKSATHIKPLWRS